MDEQKLLKRRRKALQDNNEVVLVTVCTDLASLYMEGGRYNFAIEEYTTIANIYKKQKKLTEYAVVNRGIGEAYLGLRDFKNALQHQKIYLDIARETKNRLEEQRALATIGHTYLTAYLDTTEPNRNDLDLANKFFMKSFAISQSLDGEASKLEIADMSARLFSNLGLVQECLGNLDKASSLIIKSINLCKIHDLYEQLQRGYISLAALFMKRGDSKSALQQCNLAVEAAKRLHKKNVLIPGILLSKADILIKQGDFNAAKSTLMKAYKLNTPDTKDRKEIEKNLKIVATMVNNEKKILETENTDYVKLKTLYEKMGDGACDLKLFSKGIDYYNKMLDSAIKAEMGGSDLATCYYSLAETYKDNGEFKKAIVYFEKELELCRTLKDSLNTLSKIADVKETADFEISEVKAVYYTAIEKCQKEGNVHEEGRMVKRLIAYLRRHQQHAAAFQLEQTLATLNFHSSDSETESSDAQATSSVEDEIDLDALTDVSDVSDHEQTVAKGRRRCKNFQIKRNIKGETQLHTACIKGQLTVVRHLLEQGHPVNIRDNCGWLPLHEACINGHIDVVEALLEKGAAINDRGGIQCEGITPLHDAAANGHLSIVQLLLSKGASAIAKTDGGETIVHLLKKWRSTVDLNDENNALYDSIVEQVSQALEKAGLGIEADNLQPTETVEAVTPTKNMRSALVGLDHSSPESVTTDYKLVMDTLRRKNVTKVPQKIASINKRPALLTNDDMIDDWLEDDIGKNAKKRRTNSPAKSQPSRKSSELISQRTNSVEEIQILSSDDFEESYYEKGPNSPSTSPVKRSKQAKLTSFGHTRTLEETNPIHSTYNRTKSSSDCVIKNPLPKTCSFETVVEPTLSIDVRINKKLYRVPVLLSQVNTLTIKWLSDEAALRCAKKEYMIPTLEMETKNGAVLADDDPMSLLFPMGASQAEEVEARVVKWSVPPLIDRFKEACQGMCLTPSDDLCQTLQEFSVNLDLSNRGLKGQYLAPLCKVLNRQTNLLELDLSGNFLNNECLQYLGTSMASLENLFRLNLNCTGLSSEDVQIWTNNLPADVSYNMRDLDLSDNLIGDQSLESLALLTQKFHLKRLNLSGNEFTQKIFDHSFNKDFSLNLEHLQEFDISYNKLNDEALIRILSWIKVRNLKTLNVSRNSTTEEFPKQLTSILTEADTLKICNLSRCQVKDSDVFELLRTAVSLDVLDLSYNKDLTSISLRRLLQSDIQTLNLCGCENILKYFTDFSKYLDGSSRSKTITLDLPRNSEREVEYLKQMWKELYENLAVIEVSSQFLLLTVSK